MLAIQHLPTVRVENVCRTSSRSVCSTLRLPVLPAAHAAARPAALTTAASSAAGDVQPVSIAESSPEVTFASPSTRHQPQLTGKERAALRAYSESLAKAKTIQRLQIGAQGITFNVLMACMDVLIKHEYLRVKLGEGCGCDRKQTAALLSEVLDAAVVGQVGFTITLYRQKGLPRPDNLVKPAAKTPQ